MNLLGIIVHNDKLYIAEWGNDRISVFLLDGQFSHIIGSGHLKYPCYIVVSSNDQLLVTNTGHHCISMIYVASFWWLIITNLYQSLTKMAHLYTALVVVISHHLAE